MPLTELVAGFLYGVASARGAPREFGNAGQWTALSEGRTAIVTFDDGTADLIEVAAPILRQLGIPAVAYPRDALIHFCWRDRRQLSVTMGAI